MKKYPNLIFKVIETPLGEVYAVSSENGICMLTFVDDVHLARKINRLESKFKTDMKKGENSVMTLLELELNEYFAGCRTAFTVPIDLGGTEFQQKVWTDLLKIPFGELRSYRDQAELLGDTKKVRALANGNGANIICILIPCHRVVGSNGKLTGYNCGLWRKEKLLQLEKSWKQ